MEGRQERKIMSETVKVWFYPKSSLDKGDKDNPSENRVETYFEGQSYVLNENEIKTVPYEVAAALNSANAAVTIWNDARS